MFWAKSCPKHVELILEINKLLLLHLVGLLYYKLLAVAQNFMMIHALGLTSVCMYVAYVCMYRVRSCNLFYLTI